MGAAPDPRAAVRASYDRVADEYARRIAGELAHKPLDRALLDRLADRVRGAGPVGDVGCGPGHVAAYLAERGVDARGVDLSPGMIARARALHPGVPFATGDLTALDLPDGAWAGAVAYYALVHLPRPALGPALAELARVVRPGGPLLVAFHVGSETRHLDEWWGHPVALDFEFFESDAVAAALRGAGWTLDEAVERDPYPDVEAPTRRAYLLATRAGDVTR